MKQEALIIERLKLMTEFDSFIFDNIMNEIDFYVRNKCLQTLIMFYKKDELQEWQVMRLINEI